MSDRKEKVREILSGTLNIDTSSLSDSDGIFSAGLIDSFALLALITVLESQFNIRINAADATIENLDSIDGIAALVDSVAA